MKLVAVKELKYGAPSLLPRNVFRELRKEAAVMRFVKFIVFVNLISVCVTVVVNFLLHTHTHTHNTHSSSVMRHHNLLALEGLCLDTKLCILLEYMNLGELYNFLHDS